MDVTEGGGEGRWLVGGWWCGGKVVRGKRWVVGGLDKLLGEDAREGIIGSRRRMMEEGGKIEGWWWM